MGFVFPDATALVADPAAFPGPEIAGRDPTLEAGGMPRLSHSPSTLLCRPFWSCGGTFEELPHKLGERIAFLGN